MRRNELTNLVKKITDVTAPLNNAFKYYRYNVVQQSGTQNATDVMVNDAAGNNVIDFSIDFNIMKITLRRASFENPKDMLLGAFNKVYGEPVFNMCDLTAK